MLLPLPGGLPSLQLVYTYKHVGTMATAKAFLGPEVAHRAASALAAYVPLARSMFGNAYIADGVKFLLLHTIIEGRLLYGAGSWPLLTPPRRRQDLKRSEPGRSG